MTKRRMTKAGFKAYLKRTHAKATCRSVGECVLANYLRTDLGYKSPFVCTTYREGANNEGKRIPYWGKRVIDKFDELGDKFDELGDEFGGRTSQNFIVLRAAQYRKPLLAVL